MISSLFILPWKGTEPTGLSRRESRPTLLLRDYVGDSANALVRVAWEQLQTLPPIANPVVLYGPPASGKTHLAWLLAANPPGPADRPVFWSAGADFVRQVSHAIEADAVHDFRRRFQSARLLVIDGLERIAGRGTAEAEFLVLVEHALNHQIPLVVTAPTLPLELAELSPALASRLHSGLLVPLGPPGVIARQQILAQLAGRHRVTWPADLPRRLNERLNSAPDIRPTVVELDEFVASLAQHGPTPSAPQLAASLHEFTERWLARPSVSLRTVSLAVAQYFGLKPVELKGPSRRQMVVRARGVAIYLGRRLAGESLDRLGEHFGGRDHTTALHAVRKTEQLLLEDPTLRQAVDDLTQQLCGEERR
ncbi:MAG: helix-turn-helix domain-containing protein [Pirellulales bacterium]